MNVPVDLCPSLFAIVVDQHKRVSVMVFVSRGEIPEKSRQTGHFFSNKSDGISRTIRLGILCT